MPFPFIPALVVALSAGAVGVGKTVKAGVDMHDAKETNERAQYIVERAKKEADEISKVTNHALENLGKTKLSILSDSVGPFIEVFEKIKNIELSGSKGINEIERIKSDKLIDNLKNMSDMALEVVGGIAGGAAGGEHHPYRRKSEQPHH